MNEIENIARHYGKDHQLLKLSEELMEAAEAADEYRTNQTVANLLHLSEELADVRIMVDQMEYLMPKLKVYRKLWRQYKLDRQMERIRKEKEDALLRTEG